MTNIEVKIFQEIIPETHTAPPIGMTLRFKESDRYAVDILISILKGLEGWDVKTDGDEA